MLNNIDAGERSIDNYRGIVADEVLDKLRQTAKDLKGLRILHLNATPFGGGVAELLRSIVPLLNDLGLVAEWKTITGNQDFFQVTKTIHNALQGGKESLNKEAQDLYLKISQQNAAMLEEAYDIVFVHDPQPAPIPLLHGKGDSLWVWRCHIDTSNPNPDVWGWLRQWLTAYDAAIFTMAEF
ncbi:MAG TPA: glycosyl transferase family 1, partial [Actinobacteria bacterium]|nr:glycosyl transferase family 1 [Actinomycetes bacterium]HEX21326.1 glycosyl transferase family 1 [Actinomycetota bacterium]